MYFHFKYVISTAANSYHVYKRWLFYWLIALLQWIWRFNWFDWTRIFDRFSFPLSSFSCPTPPLSLPSATPLCSMNNFFTPPPPCPSINLSISFLHRIFYLNYGSALPNLGGSCVLPIWPLIGWNYERTTGSSHVKVTECCIILDCVSDLYLFYTLGFGLSLSVCTESEGGNCFRSSYILI